MTVIYKETHCKWVKYNTPQKKYRPRGTGMQMWSKRFGYLDSYTTAERRLLVCPSGYTFNQGMGKLFKLWFAYKQSKWRADLEQMENYARAIQEVQEDMGLKTTSFPHLGIFGDVLVFRDYKTGELGEVIDHSGLKEKQQLNKELEKFEKIVPLIQKELEQVESQPAPEPGPESEPEVDPHILTLADEVPQPKGKYRIKRQNRMHYSKKRDYEWDCEECYERVPANKSHVCEHKVESNIITFSDEIPFLESS